MVKTLIFFKVVTYFSVPFNQENFKGLQTDGEPLIAFR